MKKLIILLLVSLLFLTACTPDTIALLDAIVVAAEIVIPSVSGLSPADATAVSVYLNAALTITNDLLTNGTNPQSIAKAVQDFTNLALPQLSDQVPPSVIALLQGVADAVQAFLNAYKGQAPPVLVAKATRGAKAVPPGPKIVLSSKDAKKVEDIRTRIRRDKATLARK